MIIMVQDLETIVKTCACLKKSDKKRIFTEFLKERWRVWLAKAYSDALDVESDDVRMAMESLPFDVVEANSDNSMALMSELFRKGYRESVMIGTNIPSVWFRNTYGSMVAVTLFPPWVEKLYSLKLPRSVETEKGAGPEGELEAARRLRQSVSNLTARIKEIYAEAASKDAQLHGALHFEIPSLADRLVRCVPNIIRYSSRDPFDFGRPAATVADMFRDMISYMIAYSLENGDDETKRTATRRIFVTEALLDEKTRRTLYVKALLRSGSEPKPFSERLCEDSYRSKREIEDLPLPFSAPPQVKKNRMRFLQYCAEKPKREYFHTKRGILRELKEYRSARNTIGEFDFKRTATCLVTLAFLDYAAFREELVRGIRNHDVTIRQKFITGFRQLAALPPDVFSVVPDDVACAFAYQYLDSDQVNPLIEIKQDVLADSDSEKHPQHNRSKLRPLEEIEDELLALARRQDLDFKRVMDVFHAGRAADLDEIVECASIDVHDYLVVKRLGSGAIKKAYLAVNSNSGGESALLVIDPQSKGFGHYSIMYGGLNEEDLMEKIFHEEFSATRLGEMTDTKFIAVPSKPISCKIRGKTFYYLETRKYEMTLEEFVTRVHSKGGPLSVEDKTSLFKYVYQIAYALNNCHRNGIVHKDLKPSNIGIDNSGNILLSDFGCTSMFSSNVNARYQYPLILRPPELAHAEEFWVRNGIGEQAKLMTPEANVWSFGAIVYQMFTGQTLFKGPGVRAPPGTEEYHQQNEAVYAQILSFPRSREFVNSLESSSPDTPHLLKEVLKLCLMRKAEARKGALERIMKIAESGYVGSMRGL
ncbi:protein kinase [archaeon]|nr:protein kinase [archaeon]